PKATTVLFPRPSIGCLVVVVQDQAISVHEVLRTGLPIVAHVVDPLTTTQMGFLRWRQTRLSPSLIEILHQSLCAIDPRVPPPDVDERAAGRNKRSSTRAQDVAFSCCGSGASSISERRLDIAVAEPEEIQHGVEPEVRDRVIGALLHDRLRVIRDAEPGS